MIKKTLKINGVERILILDKDETLAQVLRDHLLLTGCKIGCGEGHILLFCFHLISFLHLRHISMYLS